MNTNPNFGLIFNKRVYLERNLLNKLKLTDDKLVIKGNTPKEDDGIASIFNDTYSNFLFDSSLAALKKIENPIVSKNSSFVLYTTYPGLLVGSGYNHETGTKGDFKVGFFFDHTTGQPIIPGSSVKGVLKNFLKRCLIEHPQFFNENADFGKGLSIDLDYVSSLFGSETKEGKVTVYDAVIEPTKSTATHLFQSDFITPHKEPLKDPNPNMFLKVLPNVAFEFRFGLKDIDETKSLSLIHLFKEILLWNGIGAKTNVGYGQFSKEPYRIIENNIKVEQKQGTSILDELKEPSLPIKQLMLNGTSFEGEIILKKKENYLIMINVNNEIIYLKKKENKFKGNLPPEIGKKIKVIFIQDYTFNNPSFSAEILD
jgi:CRISPR-associated protein Cmr6